MIQPHTAAELFKLVQGIHSGLPINTALYRVVAKLINSGNFLVVMRCSMKNSVSISAGLKIPLFGRILSPESQTYLLVK
ncbi:hypothetical protein [Erwinia tasmaniensis]|uniref:Uncharacterized protein n=1 Tax=Erwinia tasmaniensis (strain DSM 17950 / CFBP 7177 / CIP 109463 / NCPPB 4357 / Et1/99) TaxID=465817 RepID=B2VKZ9_ERWT9|nr:hypothetical protein [Erwinia tasmaniensis]CAO95532.1 hypothetical protein ETA_04860 [Erwinia tasmaniensis Et1/99]